MTFWRLAPASHRRLSERASLRTPDGISLGSSDGPADNQAARWPSSGRAVHHRCRLLHCQAAGQGAVWLHRDGSCARSHDCNLRSGAHFLLHGATPLILGAAGGDLAQVLRLARFVASSDPPVGRVTIPVSFEEWRTFYRLNPGMRCRPACAYCRDPDRPGLRRSVGAGAVAETLGKRDPYRRLVPGLATVMIGRALLPALSAAAADGEIDLGRRQVLQWAWRMFGADAPSLGVLADCHAAVAGQAPLPGGVFEASVTVAVLKDPAIRPSPVPLRRRICFIQWIAATAATATSR